MSKISNRDWEKEFEKNMPKTDDKILSGERFSEDYYFGYKTCKDGEIHVVTDWGNIKNFISSLLEKQAQEIREEVEGMMIRKNKKGYSGYDIKEAGDYYGIAAESWPEIIRYEDGHDVALSDVLAIIKSKHISL